MLLLLNSVVVVVVFVDAKDVDDAVDFDVDVDDVV